MANAAASLNQEKLFSASATSGNTELLDVDRTQVASNVWQNDYTALLRKPWIRRCSI